ncbi:hypothetical protein [Stutzerimonas nitrititolerans]|uniref:hypothetical protein n=1 Tax=Stutzerimonas nitrititolerans TaxID=2482751 RepID=UPI00289A529A|nr:hypothetical protein [Stutzerimonas nitrititolerans]
MVRAILEGRKTVTRRAVKGMALDWLAEDMFTAEYVAEHSGLCPFGQPGDRLWVREAWQLHEKFTDNCVVVYKANERNSWTEFHRRFPVEVARGTPANAFQAHGFRPSIHMPRWACRILLEVTDVRVERLQDITYEQAAAEGIQRDHRMWFATDEGGKAFQHPEHAFAELWRKTGGDWHANPWVWVVEFKRVEVANA